MGYELSIGIKGGRVEIEAGSARELERRIAALDLKALEAAIQRARRGKTRDAPRAKKKR